jgi:uncharacterized membrane protein YeaQ/YmgE (transglycosylase-associated protein family)
MNITLWILAGGIVGWLAHGMLKTSANRGMVVSVMIGAAGAFFGGFVLAPMLGAAVVNPGDFSPMALVTAIAVSIACITIGNMMDKRFGV